MFKLWTLSFSMLVVGSLGGCCTYNNAVKIAEKDHPDNKWFTEHHSPAEPFQSNSITSAILAIVPPHWKLVESKDNQIPWGHYWVGEYYGRRGRLIILEGSKNVSIQWRDREGKMHLEPLAKESLELWIMPPEYHDSWMRILSFSRPLPPTLVYSGKSGKVYGQPLHHITSDARFKEVLTLANETDWLDSPYNHGNLSWAAWLKDLKSHLRGT